MLPTYFVNQLFYQGAGDERQNLIITVVLQFEQKPQNLSFRGQVYRPRNLLFLNSGTAESKLHHYHNHGCVADRGYRTGHSEARRYRARNLLCRYQQPSRFLADKPGFGMTSLEVLGTATPGGSRSTPGIPSLQSLNRRISMFRNFRPHRE